MPPAADDLTTRLGAVRELVTLFRLERLTYLVLTVVSVAMLLFVASRKLAGGPIESADMIGLFGPAGLITFSIGRLLKMWTQALQAILPIVTKTDG